MKKKCLKVLTITVKPGQNVRVKAKLRSSGYHDKTTIIRGITLMHGAGPNNGKNIAIIELYRPVITRD